MISSRSADPYASQAKPSERYKVCTRSSSSRSKKEGPVERSILKSALAGETTEKCEDSSGKKRTKRETERNGGRWSDNGEISESSWESRGDSKSIIVPKDSDGEADSVSPRHSLVVYSSLRPKWCDLPRVSSLSDAICVEGASGTAPDGPWVVSAICTGIVCRSLLTVGLDRSETVARTMTRVSRPKGFLRSFNDRGRKTIFF